MDRHPLLTSAFDKLDGAEDQLARLKRVSNEGAVTDLLKVRTDRDRQGRVRVRVESIEPPRPEWFVWIGEFLYNARSALDHLAYALNVVGFNSNPPPNSEFSQFPLYDRRARFRLMLQAARGRRSERCPVLCFPRGAVTIAERLQPYHRRHDDDTWRLGELLVLSNIDKHRRVPITTMTNAGTGMTPRKVEGHLVARSIIRYRRLEPGTTIAWLEVPTLPGEIKEPKVSFGFAADIEFVGKAGNPPVPILGPTEPVFFTLGEILGVIRERVFPDFSRFFTA